MSYHNQVMNMLKRNADYSVMNGSTSGAGEIGGARKKKVRKLKKMGSGYIGGCEGCGAGCMHCGMGSGYIGGFAGEQKERKRIKALHPGKSKNVMASRRQEFANFLALNPDLAAQYENEKVNRLAGRQAHQAAYNALRDTGLTKVGAQRAYKAAHPKKKKAYVYEYKPSKIGCNGLEAGRKKYCEFRKQFTANYIDKYETVPNANIISVYYANKKLIDGEMLTKKQQNLLKDNNNYPFDFSLLN